MNMQTAGDFLRLFFLCFDKAITGAGAGHGIYFPEKAKTY